MLVISSVLGDISCHFLSFSHDLFVNHPQFDTMVMLLTLILQGVSESLQAWGFTVHSGQTSYDSCSSVSMRQYKPLFQC